MAKGKASKAAAPGPNLLRVEDLSGGVDLRHSPTLLQPDRSRYLMNFSLREPGALVVRPGYDLFSTASMGTARCQGGQRVYLEGATFTLAAYAGGVYQPSDAGVWGSALVSGLSATNQIDFPHDRDLVAVFDGSHVPQKSTDGSTWTGMGIAAPAAGPTTGDLGGGTLVDANVYEFSYAGRDDELLHVGNESPRVTHTPSGANLSVRLTLPRHPDAQVDTLIVYARNTSAAETVRRRVGTVANPSGASTTFDVTAPNWESGDEAPATHDVPLAMKFGLVWKNRWWGVSATVGNRLCFSEIFQSQTWPALYYIDLPFSKGDTISAMVAQGDTLVVFGQNAPYLIIGQTSLDFEVRPAQAAVAGALGFRAVGIIEYGIVHASASGVYLFDGATDRLLSYDIDEGWRDLVTRSTVADLQQTALVYHDPYKELRIAVARLYPTGAAGEWVLDLNRTRLQETPAWTMTDRSIAGYLPWAGNEALTGNRGRLFSWARTTGDLFEESIGTTANGGNLTAEYHGPTHTLGLHVGRWLGLYGEYQPTGGSFSATVLVDGANQGTQTVAIGSGLSIYGTSVYGTGTYGSVSRSAFPLTLPLGAEGRSAQVKLKYVGQQTFRYYTYSLPVVVEPAVRGL